MIEKQSRGIFYGWWIVLASFLIAVYVSGAVFYSFTAFFQPIVNEYGWSYTQVSIAISLRGLEMGIFAPLMGFLVDRFGCRRLILIGVITVGFGLILLGLTRSLAMLYGALLLIALGAGGCTTVVLMAAVAHWFKKNAGKALGIVTCGFGASGAVLPLVVWLIDVYGWRAALVILGLGAWAIGIPLSFVVRDSPQQYGYFSDGDAFAESTRNSEVQEKVYPSFKEVISSRSLWLISFAEAMRFVTIMAVVIHIMPYLSSIGISRTNATLVATAIPLLSLIGRFGFGWFGDIFDKRYVLALTYCLMALGMLALSDAQVEWLILTFLILFSLGYGGGMTLRATILEEYFGTFSFGKTLGIVMGASSIGGIIGSALAGWTFDNFGSYRLIWLVFCGLNSVAIASILMSKPKRLYGQPVNEA